MPRLPIYWHLTATGDDHIQQRRLAITATDTLVLFNQAISREGAYSFRYPVPRIWAFNF